MTIESMKPAQTMAQYNSNSPYSARKYLAKSKMTSTILTSVGVILAGMVIDIFSFFFLEDFWFTTLWLGILSGIILFQGLRNEACRKKNAVLTVGDDFIKCNRNVKPNMEVTIPISDLQSIQIQESPEGFIINIEAKGVNQYLILTSRLFPKDVQSEVLHTFRFFQGKIN